MKNANILRSKWAVLSIVLTAATLAGCADPKDRMTTGALSDDYRTRHPIVLTQAEHNIDIPVSPADRTLTVGARDTIAGFAQDYKAHATGTVEILSPQGSANEPTVNAFRQQVRRELIRLGIPSPRIVQSVYSAGGAADAAPIRLRFMATTAVTNTCGQWPEDLNDRPFDNQNYYNFGCAYQNNLAAQVANPTDLVSPRGMTPADAAQRSQVISDYRTGATPTATADSFGM